MYEVTVNTRVSHDGKTQDIRAGFHDLPSALGDLLVRAGVAVFVKSYPDLDELRVADLKKIAKELGVNGFDDLRKAELIDAIEAAQ